MGRPVRGIRPAVLTGAAAAVLAAAITAAVLTTPTPAPAARTSAAPRPAGPAGPLTDTWAASPVAAPPAGGSTGGSTGDSSGGSCPASPGALDGRTIRDVVHPSISGSSVRVRLSNLFGTAPLTIGAASVAVAGPRGSLVPGTVTRLTFGGSSRVTIAPGAELVSDPAALAVTAGRDLAVSVTVPVASGRVTYHPDALQTSYLSVPGDFTMAASGAHFTTPISCWLLADAVAVTPAARVTGSVIALGDSITNGAHSTPGASRRWPDDLARRLAAGSGPTLAVVNEGITGNRLLSDAGTAGPSMLARFGRDAAGQPGARVVIVEAGINDIAQSDLGNTTVVTAAGLIRGYQQLIARAHAAGLRIIGTTLPPFRGVSFWTPAGEVTREAVNRWILTSGAFDGVINLAAILADPAHQQRLRPAFDSGDHLHPNDAGYQALADAISLPLLLHR